MLLKKGSAHNCMYPSTEKVSYNLSEIRHPYIFEIKGWCIHNVTTRSQ